MGNLLYNICEWYFFNYYKFDVGYIGGFLIVFILVDCFDLGWMKIELYFW